MSHPDPVAMLRPRRKIRGYSAILLPLHADDRIDWDGFDAHVARTADAGLIPAVNMDTGYANLIDEPTRHEALRRARAVLGQRPFVAGAFVGDRPGDRCDLPRYLAACDDIQAAGGMPVIFQSYGLTQQTDGEILSAYAAIGEHCGSFLAFELGTMFAPFGAIYSTDLYRQLIQIPACLGAKHSSLSRTLEWERLVIRDAVRPEFMVLTGNDLAIDMVMYGSDYLLGLSTFAPDLFALRDHFWASGDASFYELNDALQYLGCFAFRQPVPAYKHSAAQFLAARGWIGTDRTWPGSAERPASDRAILETLLAHLSQHWPVTSGGTGR